MTTDTQTPTAADILKTAQSALAEAKAAETAASEAFTLMSTSGMKHADGTSYSTDEMLKIAGDFKSTHDAVARAETAVKSAERAVKLDTLDKPMGRVVDGLKKLLADNGMADLLVEADAGLTITFTAAIARDAADPTKWQNWAVSRKYANAASNTAPKVDGAATNNTGSVGYEYNGATYSSRDLIANFAQPLIDNGTLKWTGDPTDSVGLTHRADALATKLGATKTK